MSTGEGLLSELSSKVAFGRRDRNRRKKKSNTSKETERASAAAAGHEPNPEMI